LLNFDNFPNVNNVFTHAWPVQQKYEIIAAACLPA